MNIVADGSSPLKGSRIVVADRHAHNRTALREMVSSLGASSVSHAQSAGEVMRAVRARDVDIILCHYHLEDQRDGQQLLEELRHDRVIPLGDACQASIAYWAEKEPGAELLAAARTRLPAVLRQYGMDSRPVAMLTP